MLNMSNLSNKTNNFLSLKLSVMAGTDWECNNRCRRDCGGGSTVLGNGRQRMYYIILTGTREILYRRVWIMAVAEGDQIYRFL